MSKLSPEQRQKILDSYERTKSIRMTILECQSSHTTVKKVLDSRAVPLVEPKPYRPVAFLPDPDPAAGGAALPESLAKAPPPLRVDAPGWWLVIGDTHFPYHDKSVIEAAFREGREKNAVGVLLNGDLMDMFACSSFFKEPTRETLADEIACGRAALAWMRSRLPGARFIFREGNHDFRLRRFIIDKAPELHGLPVLELPNLLGLPDLGVEWVQDKRKIFLGKLATYHGHETRKVGGEYPVVRLMNWAKSPALMNHHHKVGSFRAKRADDAQVGAWVVGCACHLKPHYDPEANWQHGYAMVEVFSDGWFHVHNHQLIEGRKV